MPKKAAAKAAKKDRSTSHSKVGAFAAKNAFAHSAVPWQVEVDGDDLVVRNILVTCFGGVQDVLSGADNGHTASGVDTVKLVNGKLTDTMVKGCALPVLASQAETMSSPLAFTPHIPWKTSVRFWSGNDEASGREYPLLDNGPDVLHYPTHAADLTPAAAQDFAPDMPISAMHNSFSVTLSFRILGGTQFQ
jgi:hypothetical protein